MGWTTYILAAVQLHYSRVPAAIALAAWEGRTARVLKCSKWYVVFRMHTPVRAKCILHAEKPSLRHHLAKNTVQHHCSLIGRGKPLLNGRIFVSTVVVKTPPKHAAELRDHPRDLEPRAL